MLFVVFYVGVSIVDEILVVMVEMVIMALYLLGVVIGFELLVLLVVMIGLELLVQIHYGCLFVVPVLSTVIVVVGVVE